MSPLEAPGRPPLEDHDLSRLDGEAAQSKEHERLAAIILDGMYQFVGLLNAKGDILEVNRAALEGAGHQIQEIRGNPFWTARWWQVSEQVQEDLKVAIRRAAAGEFVRYEVDIYGEKAGLDPITIDFSLQPIRGETDEVEYLLAEGRNLTERKRAEEQVARQAHELRILNDRLTELDRVKTSNTTEVNGDQRSTVLLADDNADMREYVQGLLQRQHRVIAVSNGKEALDAVRKEVPDLILTDVMMPVLDGFGLLNAIRSDPAIRATPVVMLSARAGEESRIEGLQSGADDYLIKPFTERELLARVGAHLALSKLRKELMEHERGQAQQETEQRKRDEQASALLAAIVQSSEDAIISKDLNATITSWNSGAERIFGFTAEEAVGQPITMLMPPDRLNEEPELLERIRRGQRIEHYETVRHRKDGTLLDISLTISPIVDTRGKIIGASKIARNITDRKRIEATLLKAHALGAAGRIAASVAHEINNPLAAVTNLLYLMRPHVTSETGAKNLAMAEAELARVARITKKTLTYYRDTSKPEPVDLSEVITETLSVFVKKIADKQITVARTDEPCTVRGLKGELQQLFSNLIANAIDAVGTGGKIDIAVRESRDAATVTVRDNGVGISPDQKSKLFEPFFTTKEQHLGTGLGLWISKEIAQKHGAEIEVESSTDPPDHGTAFTVTFPDDTLSMRRSRTTASPHIDDTE
jgi:PAS domain S-box-containing protein